MLLMSTDNESLPASLINKAIHFHFGFIFLISVFHHFFLSCDCGPYEVKKCVHERQKFVYKPHICAYLCSNDKN